MGKVGKKRGEKVVAKQNAKSMKAAAEANLHPAIAALKSSRKQKIEMTDDEREKAATALIIQMKTAVAEDNEANSNRKPALKKLLLLEEVTKSLRRIPIQEHFIERGGCNALADWLYPLPDGTYPNVKVVQEILQVIDTLHIETNFL